MSRPAQKVNGFRIKEAIKQWTLQRDICSGQFQDSLTAFKDSNKLLPEEIMRRFHDADVAIAELEIIQQTFNRSVMVTVPVISKQPMMLALAVKLIGGAGRREKMWRDAASNKKSRYDYGNSDVSRSKDMEYAERTISNQQALELSKTSAKIAAELRSAIAEGNSTNLTIYELNLPFDRYCLLFDVK